VPAADWATGVTVTAHAVNDFVRQDPHDTTIAVSVVDSLTPDTGYQGAVDASLGVRVIDDDTPGVVVVESNGSTLVTACGDTACDVPGLGDDYRLRLTLQPTAPVDIAIVTDGQTDVTTGGRVSLKAIGGLTARQQFLGNLTISPRQLPRRRLRPRPADPDRGRLEPRRLPDRRRRRRRPVADPGGRSCGRVVQRCDHRPPGHARPLHRPDRI
jgi:hypothetical protein